MPSSFENPFIPKPDNLKPDSAEFLHKYAGASDEQLKKAGLSGAKGTPTPEASELESADNLKEAVSDEEKTAYENELVECDGIQLRRADALAVEEIIKKLNKTRAHEGQPEIALGQEIKVDRLAIGGKTKEQLKEELQAANIKTSSYADDLLKSPEFKPLAEPEDVVLVCLTVADLGFPQGATTKGIYQRAQELGLDLCPPETGPQLRVKDDTEQRFGEYFNIAMKQITDSNGYPRVVCLLRAARVQWLDANRADPSNRWSGHSHFVFRLRPTSQKLRGAGK
ncbi:MAG: hypothetical protein U1E51_24295 [Candidatus Binatia bacterium]|nr:hypothetical protein [Candidatus Binatia bacterium]